MTITPVSVQTITDPRLGAVVSANFTISAQRELNKAPKLVAWTIQDQSGKAYRYFDFPQTKQTAVYVRGLEPWDYQPGSNLTFSILFPLQQIPTNAGTVFLDGSVDVGLRTPEPFRIKVR